MVDAAADKKSQMEYRYLGRTGLKVSVIGFGTYMMPDTKDAQKLTTDCVRELLKYGVNFFDTAEVYDTGKSETALGNTFKELNVRREEIVVSTKVYWENMFSGTPSINSIGLSRKHVIEGVKNSLKRL